MESTKQSTDLQTQPKQAKGDRPDYKGDGIAVWVNLDKNGKQYLSVKVLGMKGINCFANTPREESA